MQRKYGLHNSLDFLSTSVITNTNSFKIVYGFSPLVNQPYFTATYFLQPLPPEGGLQNMITKF